MIIYEGKEPYNDEMSEHSDPFMFVLGLVFLLVMLVYWGGEYLYKKVKA